MNCVGTKRVDLLGPHKSQDHYPDKGKVSFCKKLLISFAVLPNCSLAYHMIKVFQAKNKKMNTYVKMIDHFYETPIVV